MWPSLGQSCNGEENLSHFPTFTRLNFHIFKLSYKMRTVMVITVISVTFLGSAAELGWGRKPCGFTTLPHISHTPPYETLCCESSNHHPSQHGHNNRHMRWQDKGGISGWWLLVFLPLWYSLQSSVFNLTPCLALPVFTLCYFLQWSSSQSFAVRQLAASRAIWSIQFKACNPRRLNVRSRTCDPQCEEFL